MLESRELRVNLNWSSLLSNTFYHVTYRFFKSFFDIGTFLISIRIETIVSLTDSSTGGDTLKYTQSVEASFFHLADVIRLLVFISFF